jgi:hypothetical protein
LLSLLTGLLGSSSGVSLHLPLRPKLMSPSLWVQLTYLIQNRLKIHIMWYPHLNICCDFGGKFGNGTGFSPSTLVSSQYHSTNTPWLFIRPLATLCNVSNCERRCMNHIHKCDVVCTLLRGVATCLKHQINGSWYLCDFLEPSIKLNVTFISCSKTCSHPILKILSARKLQTKI